MRAAWIVGVQPASARLSLVGCEWRSLAAGCSSLRVHVDLGREGYAPPLGHCRRACGREASDEAAGCRSPALSWRARCLSSAASEVR